MSYKVIKRILGEASLEQKLRVIFGVCLLVLIVIPFYWVSQVSEDLIQSNMRVKASQLINLKLLQLHFSVNTGQKEKLLTEFVKKTGDELSVSVKNFQLMHPNKQTANAFFLLRPLAGQSEEESQIIKELMEAKLPTEAEILGEGSPLHAPEIATAPPKGTASTNQQPTSELANVDTPTNQNSDNQLQADPVNKELTADQFQNKLAAVEHFPSRVTTLGADYNYYRPILLTDNLCLCCHNQGEELKDLFPNEKELYEQAGDQKAIRVIGKITIPYTVTRRAINRTRAILASVAIFTVVMSMLALWAVVRYVVVKPVRHLIETTDEISTGQLTVRADLNTGDEFEKLATSFNNMLHNITEAQENLRRTNYELDKRNDEQAKLNMELQEMNQMKSEFLANMSHELRTPLNSIIGFSEVLESNEKIDKKQKRFAGNIRKSGRLLLELINDILDLAKLEAGKMEIKAVEFQIEKMIASLVDLLLPLSEEKRINLTFQVDQDLPELFQDQMKVHQILTNLLSNAIKFTPEGGRIHVSAHRVMKEQTRDPQLVLSVADTGVGISAADRVVIFEKFRQGASATGQNSLTREHSGTGLGLSIVRELCQLMKGDVMVDSEVGKGTTFTIRLPWRWIEQPKLDAGLTQKLDQIIKPARPMI